MRIDTNQTNFNGVKITKTAMEVLSQRMPSGKFTLGLNELKNKYENSPVNMTIDTFSHDCKRLDAIIYYNKGNKSDSIHIMENKLSFFLSLNPIKFIKKAVKTFEQMEQEFKTLN